jgi:hypothetical protein
VCSTPNERLARLRAAIDVLAAQAGLPDSPADLGAGQAGAAAGAATEPGEQGRTGPTESEAGEAETEAGETGAGGAEDIDARLARLWQMLAQLDPELARRLPRYLG